MKWLPGTLWSENAFPSSSIFWWKVRMSGTEKRNGIFCLSWHHVSNFLVEYTLALWMVKITFWGRPRAFRLNLASPWDSTSVDVDEKFSLLLRRGSLWAEEGSTDLNTAVELFPVSIASYSPAKQTDPHLPDHICPISPESPEPPLGGASWNVCCSKGQQVFPVPGHADVSNRCLPAYLYLVLPDEQSPETVGWDVHLLVQTSGGIQIQRSGPSLKISHEQQALLLWLKPWGPDFSDIAKKTLSSPGETDPQSSIISPFSAPRGLPSKLLSLGSNQEIPLIVLGLISSSSGLLQPQRIKLY